MFRRAESSHVKSLQENLTCDFTTARTPPQWSREGSRAWPLPGVLGASLWGDCLRLPGVVHCCAWQCLLCRFPARGHGHICPCLCAHRCALTQVGCTGRSVRGRGLAQALLTEALPGPLFRSPHLEADTLVTAGAGHPWGLARGSGVPVDMTLDPRPQTAGVPPGSL